MSSIFGDDATRRVVLRSVEDDILQRTGNVVEHAVGLDADGRVVFERAGGVDGVLIGQTVRDRLRGTIDLLTHNHPHGSPVSDADAFIAIDLDVREVNAFTPTTRWRLIRGGAGWPSLDEVAVTVEQAAPRVLAGLQAQVDAYRITVTQGQRRFFTLLWGELQAAHPEWFTLVRESR